MAQTKLESNNGTTRLVRSTRNVGLLLERGSIASKLPAQPSIRHLGIKQTKEKNVVRRESGEAGISSRESSSILRGEGMRGKAWDTRTNNGLEITKHKQNERRSGGAAELARRSWRS